MMLNLISLIYFLSHLIYFDFCSTFVLVIYVCNFSHSAIWFSCYSFLAFFFKWNSFTTLVVICVFVFSCRIYVLINLLFVFISSCVFVYVCVYSASCKVSLLFLYWSIFVYMCINSVFYSAFLFSCLIIVSVILYYSC